MNHKFDPKDIALLALSFLVITLVVAFAGTVVISAASNWYVTYFVLVVSAFTPVGLGLLLAYLGRRAEQRKEASETFSSYPAGYGQTQTLEEKNDPPMVVYCYRYSDGRTQVRAPHVTNPHLVLDILAQSEDAIRNGRPVTLQ